MDRRYGKVVVLNTKVVEIIRIGTEYVAYYHGVVISKGKSLVRVSKALAQHIKGQQ